MRKGQIEFLDVSKRYFIGEHSVRTLRDDLGRFMGSIFKKEINAKQQIWGLKDVSFKVGPGDSVGIVGPNGSGKTTIFKLISKITYPTKGKILVGGRVGSLIDISAGFHSELTGLENIYLNAAIRGMKRREIRKHLDSIIEFAGIEKFRDTPVKHYSAGMCVRLGFSVAVFCPFDILLIDEVLAVGDISFQMKCFEKIFELKCLGKTILFVSQDLDKVKQVCSKIIYLSYGRIIMYGDKEKVTSRYISDVRKV